MCSIGIKTTRSCTIDVKIVVVHHHVGPLLYTPIIIILMTIALLHDIGIDIDSLIHFDTQIYRIVAKAYSRTGLLFRGVVSRNLHERTEPCLADWRLMHYWCENSRWPPCWTVVRPVYPHSPLLTLTLSFDSPLIWLHHDIMPIQTPTAISKNLSSRKVLTLIAQSEREQRFRRLNSDDSRWNFIGTSTWSEQREKSWLRSSDSQKHR